MRKAKDQKVVIGFQTKDELAAMKEKLGSAKANLKIEEKSNKDPIIIIKNLLSYNSDENLIPALKNQNTQLLGNLSNENLRAKIKYRRKARNPHESHVILSVGQKPGKNLQVLDTFISTCKGQGCMTVPIGAVYSLFAIWPRTTALYRNCQWLTAKVVPITLNTGRTTKGALIKPSKEKQYRLMQTNLQRKKLAT